MLQSLCIKYAEGGFAGDQCRNAGISDGSLQESLRLRFCFAKGLDLSIDKLLVDYILPGRIAEGIRSITACVRQTAPGNCMGCCLLTRAVSFQLDAKLRKKPLQEYECSSENCPLVMVAVQQKIMYLCPNRGAGVFQVVSQEIVSGYVQSVGD